MNLNGWDGFYLNILWTMFVTVSRGPYAFFVISIAIQKILEFSQVWLWTFIEFKDFPTVKEMLPTQKQRRKIMYDDYWY